MTHAKDVLPFRRKREGRTNYKKRLALLKSGKPRLVIRRSNRYVQLQLVTYEHDGDRVLLTLTSKALAKHGWTRGAKSTPAAYLTGVLFAQAAKAKKIDEAIVDIGFQKHRAGTRICAVIKGVVDGGLAVPADEEIFPAGDRINGAHIGAAADVAAIAAKLGVTLPKAEPKPKQAKREPAKAADAKGGAKPQKAKPDAKGAPKKTDEA